MSGVVGKVREIRKLSDQIEELGGKAFFYQLSEEISEEALDLVKQTFETQSDPYRKAWPPLKKDRARNIKAGERKGKNRGSVMLRDTGRLYNSLNVQNISASGFDLTAGTVYAAVHNFGHTFPPRQQKYVLMQRGNALFVPNVTPLGPIVKETTLNITIPKRQFIPSNGLPARWRSEFLDIYLELARDLVGQ